MFIRAIKTELKRAFRSWTFVVAAGLCFVVFLSEVWDDLKGASTSNQALMFSMSLVVSGFLLIAPIIAAIPYSFSFCDDYNTGYYRLLAVRQRYSTYLVSKCLGTALAGGLALSLGTALYAVFLYICFPLYIPGISQAASTLGLDLIWEHLGYTQGAWLLIVVQIVLCMLSGMVWATVGLMFSALVPNRYVAIAIPFILYLTCFLVMSRLGLDRLSPATFLVPYQRSDTTLIEVVLYELVFCAIAATIFYKLAKRRLQNA
jgi:ABC-type transport system involved in multi-copper enzyme maturation permease subunit